MSCIACEDYQEVDDHASQFPIDTIPSYTTNPFKWLATNLCGPYWSKDKKARAIFTWICNNIAYGYHDKRSEAMGTLQARTGTCGGYAELFKAIADEAGLVCFSIPGHSKKRVEHALTLGAEIPEYSRDTPTHQWNAFRTDADYDKVIDVCWGAGYVQGDGVFVRQFNVQWFTRSNGNFQYSHFPQDPSFQLTRHRISWDQFVKGPHGGVPVPKWNAIGDEEGLDQYSLHPPSRHIRRDGKDVFFTVSRICRHGESNALPLVLDIDNTRQPLKYEDGRWTLGISANWIKGLRGQTIELDAVTKYGGADARGITITEWEGDGTTRLSIAAWTVL